MWDENRDDIKASFQKPIKVYDRPSIEGWNSFSNFDRVDFPEMLSILEDVNYNLSTTTFRQFTYQESQWSSRTPPLQHLKNEYETTYNTAEHAVINWVAITAAYVYVSFNPS
jgi:hypothetical protein